MMRALIAVPAIGPVATSSLTACYAPGIVTTKTSGQLLLAL